MSRNWRVGIGVVLAWVALVTVSGAWARQAASGAGDAAGAAAPVPPALLTGKKIFISNAGADSGLFPHPFSGTPDRAYGEFYGVMQGWGRYEIVSGPAEADLVMELRLWSPNGPSNADKQKGASDPLPMFRLVIYDAKSHYVFGR